ncbi:MAG: FAD-binding oxidoreductase [Proteobacteria bacterium]|nr:FAD-binding oxidoreductase [Pseudomonadota bacterium]
MAKQDYQNKKKQLVETLQQLSKKNRAIRLQKDTSNLFRDHNLKHQNKIDVRAFNQVIKVDPARLIAEVEAMTPFSTIVKETLKYHCLPLVVPELKSITIGGALSGVGIEASSFRYGFVHDGITQFEVLTGSGKIIECSADNEYSDLFYAFPNSYGTLGYALKATIKLIAAGPFVKLTHYHFSNAGVFFKELEALCLANHITGDLAFIEGVIFNADDLVITTGEFVNQAPSVSNYKYLQIYYKSLQQKSQDYLTTEDFIWRWDPDWFWCSRVFGMQNTVLRFLLGKWLLKSTAYWKMMRLVNKNPLANYFYQRRKLHRETIIQDVLIPIEQSVNFYEFFAKNINITPIWICPYMAYHTAKPYNFFPTEANRLYVDFGFWDSVQSNENKGYYNRLIENKVTELGGLKSLYSEAFYSEAQFWQIYDKNHYQNLKQKYDPNQILNDLYKKCVLSL